MRISNLYLQFRQRGINIFQLNGGLFFWKKDHINQDVDEGPIPLIPPVVEVSIENGKPVMLINDGMHRVYAARRFGQKINIVLATGVPAEYPYYAHPVENGWDGVVELDELPDNFVKKTYRNPHNYKELFRDFNAVFEGVQTQRKRTNPAFDRVPDHADDRVPDRVTT
ncbi:MAG: hypothetical protein HQL75_00195 [Magnetococcales bacterium]|nr:hypothetical protein [Magnetococcales bacterium]